MARGVHMHDATQHNTGGSAGRWVGRGWCVRVMRHAAGHAADRTSNSLKSPNMTTLEVAMSLPVAKDAAFIAVAMTAPGKTGSILSG